MSTIAVMLAAMLLVPAAVFAASRAHDATSSRPDSILAGRHPDNRHRS